MTRRRWPTVEAIGTRTMILSPATILLALFASMLVVVGAYLYADDETV